MEFSSGQALGGHMRVHNKGIRPDQKTEDSDGSVGGIDLLKGLPSWAKTSKRSCPSSCKAALGLVQLSDQDASGGPIELPNSHEADTSLKKPKLEESSSNGPREEGTGCEKPEAGQNPGRADKRESRAGPRGTDVADGSCGVRRVVAMAMDNFRATVPQAGQGDDAIQPPSTGLKDGPSHGAREDQAGPGALEINLNKPPQIDLNELSLTDD